MSTLPESNNKEYLDNLKGFRLAPPPKIAQSDSHYWQEALPDEWQALEQTVERVLRSL
jgi:hypothetical protein